MQERVKSAGKPKKKVTLEVDTALATDAAAEGIDLGSLLEQGLQARAARKVSGGLTEHEQENLRWLEEYVAQHGDWWDDEEDQQKAS